MAEPLGSWQKLNLFTACAFFLVCKLQELLSFFSLSRKHMKEGLLELTEDDFGGGFEAVSIKLP